MSEVINLFSGRPKEVEDAEIRVLEEQAREVLRVALNQHQETMLGVLDDIRALVETGRLEGFIFVGRAAETGLFCTEVLVRPPAVPLSQLFAYVGALETVKMELADYATGAPALLVTGEVIDPLSQAHADEEGEEYE